jgi:hypothetical protein
MSGRHGGPELLCTACQRSFTNQGNLTNHSRRCSYMLPRTLRPVVDAGSVSRSHVAEDLSVWQRQHSETKRQREVLGIWCICGAYADDMCLQAGHVFAPFVTKSDALWTQATIEEGMGPRVRQRLLSCVRHPGFSPSAITLTSEGLRKKAIEKLPGGVLLYLQYIPDVSAVYVRHISYARYICTVC